MVFKTESRTDIDFSGMLQPGNRQTGAVGVARVIAGLLASGWNVLTPFEDNAGYDIVAEKDGTFKRIQVKSCGAPRLQNSGKRGPSYKFTTGRGVEKRRYGKCVDLIIMVGLDKDLLWIFESSKIKATYSANPEDSVAWTSLSKI
jgi:hypothetical protein